VAAGDIEFLRGVYEEWARGDYSRKVFASDIESEYRGFVAPHGTQSGLEDVLEAQREWLQGWERPFVVEAEEFIDAGDLIVVFVRWRGRGKGSGVEIEAEGAHLWQMRGGVAVRWDVYRDRAEALSVAGLPSQS
jgi:ketosteroid isomerase-like protein